METNDFGFHQFIGKNNKTNPKRHIIWKNIDSHPCSKHHLCHATCYEALDIVQILSPTDHLWNRRPIVCFTFP